MGETRGIDIDAKKEDKRQRHTCLYDGCCYDKGNNSLEKSSSFICYMQTKGLLFCLNEHVMNNDLQS